jgi:hypothetical protein
MACRRKRQRAAGQDIELSAVSQRGCLKFWIGRGLRASEVCDLRWDQISFTGAVLHVRRRKNGTPSTQPLGGVELRSVDRVVAVGMRCTLYFRDGSFSTELVWTKRRSGLLCLQ